MSGKKTVREQLIRKCMHCIHHSGRGRRGVAQGYPGHYCTAFTYTITGKPVVLPIDKARDFWLPQNVGHPDRKKHQTLKLVRGCATGSDLFTPKKKPDELPK
jgi:hypothetical protein